MFWLRNKKVYFVTHSLLKTCNISFHALHTVHSFPADHDIDCGSIVCSLRVVLEKSIHKNGNKLM